jgi:hypothetical protein
MKTKHKLLLIFLLLSTTGILRSQNIAYYYDNAGNRIERTIVMSSALRSAEESSDVTAVEDLIADHAVKIYPNPTQGMLAVEIANFTDDLSVDFLLTNASGRVIDRQQATSGYQTFNLSNQVPGIYLLRIRIEDAVTTWKIIKE